LYGIPAPRSFLLKWSIPFDALTCFVMSCAVIISAGRHRDQDIPTVKQSSVVSWTTCGFEVKWH
jgi:hypothetical protein